MDKISIIIPVYNGEKYLERCILSLINQTYNNIELIFINDGSTDNSISILNKYKKKDKRITIIDKKNTGVSDSRNIGIDKSTGKYICFCDCDDIYDKNYIKIMHDTIVKNNNYKVIDSNSKFLSQGNLELDTNKVYDKNEIINDLLPLFLEGTIPCFSYLLMIKKSKLKSKFPLDIAMMEDVVFYLRLLLSVENIYILDESLYTIMYNDEGATNNISNYKRNILNILSVNKYIKDILTKENISTKDNINKININNLNAISDFIFKNYLYGENTILLCHDICNEDFINIVNETDMLCINKQRRIILKYISKNKYFKLRIYLFLRKIFHNIKNIFRR